MEMIGFKSDKIAKGLKEYLLETFMQRGGIYFCSMAFMMCSTSSII